MIYVMPVMKGEDTINKTNLERWLVRAAMVEHEYRAELFAMLREHIGTTEYMQVLHLAVADYNTFTPFYHPNHARTFIRLTGGRWFEVTGFIIWVAEEVMD